ncbi:MAG: lipopolysaccharide kinase InaA family protein, partial [Stellaceae bacterium]
AIYRGAVLTRALAGMTLWEFLQTDDDARVRAHVLELARRAIDTMHRGGLFHADLNLHNLFVTPAGDSFAVVILDLDKARLFPAAISARQRGQNLQRLMRSAHRLDPAGALFSPAALAILTGT